MFAQGITVTTDVQQMLSNTAFVIKRFERLKKKHNNNKTKQKLRQSYKTIYLMIFIVKSHFDVRGCKTLELRKKILSGCPSRQGGTRGHAERLYQ